MQNVRISKGSHKVSNVISFEHLLTKRELEISGLIAQGQNSWQISRRLHISEGTVKNHLSSVFEKTGVRNRTELAAKYIAEYENAVTDIINLPFDESPSDHDYMAQAVARFRLLRNNSLPNIIPLVFNEQSFIIGRFDSNIGCKLCDFEFEPATKAVSRRHAEIELSEPGFTITDLNSRAGTFLNGEKILPGNKSFIKHGDQISFGTAGADYVFEVL